MIKFKIDKRTEKNLHKVLRKNKAFADSSFSLEMKKMLAEATARGKKNAPVDTGRLRSSIGYDSVGRKNFVFHALAPYASFVEYGTIWNRAQPYFFRSLERAKQNLIRRIDMALKKINKR